MTWLDGKKPADPVNAEESKVPEKTVAEMIAEGLKPFNEAVGKLQTRIDEVADQTKKPAPKDNAEPVTTVSVLDDENLAFAQRMTPMVMRQLELEAKIVRNDVKDEYNRAGLGELWAKFDGEISGILEGSPLVTAEGKQMRGDPQYIRNVVDMVFGRNARKAGMGFDSKEKGFFLESASGGDGHVSAPVADGLTDGQRKVFGRMKVSTEDAKKVMGKLHFVS